MNYCNCPNCQTDNCPNALDEPKREASVSSGELLGGVLFSALGQIFVFTATGQQVPELQKPPIILWAERAESLGYNVDGQRIKTYQREIVLHKSDYGWNFSVVT